MNEADRLAFKYAKSQSSFLQIMRDLTRFNTDFHNSLSIRSRLVQTKVAARDLSELLTTNENVLLAEQRVLAQFAEKKARLKVKREQTRLVVEHVDQSEITDVD